jgi:transposase
MNLATTLAPALLDQLPEPLRLAVAQLADQLQGLQALVQTLQTQNQSLTTENQLLRQKLDALIRRYFGSPKNEGVDPQQLQLLLAGLPVEPAPTPAPAPETPASPNRPARARRPARSGLPENLPVQRVVLLPTEVQEHPEQFRQIEEVLTKELDFEPGHFFWRHYVRPKFVRRPVSTAAETTPAGHASVAASTTVSPVALALAAAAVCDLPEVLIAALPNRLIEKGLPGVGLLVHLILSRFEDHLPYYRLEKIFRERHQVPLARQSMMDWADQLAQWLQPIYRQMKQELLAGHYVQADETPIWYLDREVPGRSCQGYLWVYSRPGGNVLFEWRTGRGREGPQEFLRDFQGQLQCDGYEVYPSLVANRTDRLLIFCWAHVRRKFFEAQKHDRRAAWFVKQISLLYALERRLREGHAGPALRAAARSAEATMVLARIGRALQRLQPHVLPQSLLGQAIGYTVKLWPGLNEYVAHGHVEIDNNSVENAIRPTAIGKKNFLFIGHPETGWRSAVIYSILGSCRRYGLDPAQYLRDVLTRLPDMKQSEIPGVTPKAWAKAHPQARVLPVT